MVLAGEIVSNSKERSKCRSCGIFFMPLVTNGIAAAWWIERQQSLYKPALEGVTHQ
jgi:hypothetical protein